jgi:RND family efflux transporter MFP subunit
VKLLIIAVSAAFFLLAGCSSADKEGKAQEKPTVAVEVSTVSTQTLTEGVEVTGSLEPKFSADVKTQIPGLVKQVFVTEWVRVRKGQPLASIDVSEAEALVKRAQASLESARAGLSQAKVSLTRSEREEARMLKLKEAGLATQQAVDDARSETEAAAARMEAARAQIRVAEEDVRQSRVRQGKGMVTAPMDGVVALRAVNVGDLASDAATGKPIFRIVDNRILNLTVTVPSSDTARIKTGQPLEFNVDALPGKIFTGKVMYINPELSTADRSLSVIAEVSNGGDLLKGGLFVKGRIVTGTRALVLQVPRSALAAWDSASRSGRVFVITDGAARMKQVETGIVSGDLVEIVNGLAVGEQLVVRGGFNLKDGDRVTIAGKEAGRATP